MGQLPAIREITLY